LQESDDDLLTALLEESNINIPGKWAFRVDLPPDDTTTGSSSYGYQDFWASESSDPDPNPTTACFPVNYYSSDYNCDMTTTPEICTYTFHQSNPADDMNLPVIDSVSPSFPHFYPFGYEVDYIAPRHEGGCTDFITLESLPFPYLDETYSSLKVSDIASFSCVKSVKL